MQAVLYRKILSKEFNCLTDVAKLVYCFFASKVYYNEVGFDSRCNNNGLQILKNDDLSTNPYREMMRITNAKVMESLNITEPSLIEAKKSLERNGYIKGDKIYVTEDFYKGGFVPLQIKSGLHGGKLIFLSWYVPYCLNHNNADYSTVEQLAFYSGIDKRNVKRYINELTKTKFVVREREGKKYVTRLENTTFWMEGDFQYIETKADREYSQFVKNGHIVLKCADA